VDAPVGVKPALKCWMEINEGLTLCRTNAAALRNIRTFPQLIKFLRDRDGLAH